ncbi:hypothetical protein [Lysinibacillus sp. TE18511]
MRKRSANVASAMFYLCESTTTATTNVLSARKRSVSGKAPSRNGNQPLILPKSRIMTKEPPLLGSSFHII